jgi:hypothetical protein
VPDTFTALSRTVYEVPFVRLEITIGDVVCEIDVYVDPLFTEYWYPVIAAPPLSVGATNAILSVFALYVDTSDVGAPGTVDGIAETLVDAAPSPITLTALRRIV